MRPRQKPTCGRRSLLNIGNTATIAIGSLMILPSICLCLRHVGDATSIAVGRLVVAVTIVAAFILLVDVGDAAAGTRRSVLVGLRALHWDCHGGDNGERVGLEGHDGDCEGLRESHICVGSEWVAERAWWWAMILDVLEVDQD